tara:strand:+ start:613 stop:1305 length:693 start_codon:yes stop_codon:yes gene_type:complete
MHIKHVFFDLDRTIWDFETNAYKTLLELYQDHALNEKGISDVDVFINNYKTHNENLWKLYRDGEIEKDVLRSRRFKLTLQDFGNNDDCLAIDLGNQYVQKCPLKTHVFPFTYEVLDYLNDKYHLHIITNGFEEVQYVKLEQSKLLHYFEQVVTSEQVGVKKPNPEIFRYALVKAFCKPNESIMIGDDLPVDILGAKAMGMHQVYFNPKKIAHQESIDFEISCLSQLQELL